MQLVIQFDEVQTYNTASRSTYVQSEPIDQIC